MKITIFTIQLMQTFTFEPVVVIRDARVDAVQFRFEHLKFVLSVLFRICLKFLLNSISLLHQIVLQQILQFVLVSFQLQLNKTFITLLYQVVGKDQPCQDICLGKSEILRIYEYILTVASLSGTITVGKDNILEVCLRHGQSSFQ